LRTTLTTLIGFAAIAALVVAQAPSTAPDALLERGIASYRAAQYADAAKDLKAASDALLSTEQMQAYVNSGKFANIDKFEKALVYLTLAETKLGHKEQAREAVLRLVTAERIDNAYARLPLDADAAEFPQIAARLVPGTKLGASTQIAAAPAQTAPAATPAAATTPNESERADRQRAIDEAVAAERVKMQREADERVAAALAAAEREAQAQIVPASAQAQTQVRSRPDYLLQLRQADAYADNDQLNRANELYNSIADAADAPRDIVAEAGIGLYRTGAYRDAASVFRKLVPFARGEEDLRYYNAVALYETGDYGSAKRELACALPFIQANDDVERYRAKIERTPAIR